MFNYSIIPFGYAVNPTLTGNFSDLPNSYKPNGDVKKWLSTNWAKLSEDEIHERVSFVLGSSRGYSFRTFNQSIPMSSISKEEFKEDLCRHLALNRDKQPKIRNRYFLANHEGYLQALGEAREGKKGEALWSLFKLHDRGLNDYITTVMNGGSIYIKEDAMALLEKYSSGVKFETDELARFAFCMRIKMDFYSSNNPVASAMTLVLEHALKSLELRQNIELAVQCLWSIAYFKQTPELFFLTYHFFKNDISKENFPFLRFSILDKVDDFLVQTNSLNTFYSQTLVKVVDYIVGNNNSSQAHFLLSNLFDNQEAFVNKSVSTFEAVQDFGNMVKEVLEPYAELFIRFNDNGFGILPINIRDNLRANGKKLRELQRNAVMKIISIKENYPRNFNEIKALDNIDQQLEKVDRKAADLGKNPLENIDKLQSLSVKKKELSSDKINLTSKVILVLKEIATKTNEITQYYANGIIKLDQEITSDLDVFQMAIDDIDELKVSLRDREQIVSKQKTDIENLERKIKILEHQLSAPESLSLCSSSDVELGSIITKILQKKASVKDVIEAALNINSENIIISPVAIKSIESLAGFNRVDVLFEKILILTSSGFIGKYKNIGSHACFELLTKNELSFQESKATRSIHDRKYIVNDVEYDCRAHLKIGSDNTEQNMLRIYFAIKDSKIVIGDISKHLPIATAI